MRISCEPDDAGYVWWKNAAKDQTVYVFFEGVRITHGITADDRQGYVKTYVLDDCGMPCLDHTGESLMTKELHGRVEILFRPRTGENR